MTRFLPHLRALPGKIKAEFIAWLWGEGFTLLFGTIRRVAEVGLAVPIILSTPSGIHNNANTEPENRPAVMATATHKSSPTQTARALRQRRGGVDTT